MTFDEAMEEVRKMYPVTIATAEEYAKRLNEFVSKDRAMEVFCASCIYEKSCKGYCKEAKQLLYLPAADVVPVRHGRWISHELEFGGLVSECSVCHAEGMIDGNFCPNCGARMDEVTHECFGKEEDDAV